MKAHPELVHGHKFSNPNYMHTEFSSTLQASAVFCKKWSNVKLLSQLYFYTSIHDISIIINYHAYINAFTYICLYAPATRLYMNLFKNINFLRHWTVSVRNHRTWHSTQNSMKLPKIINLYNITKSQIDNPNVEVALAQQGAEVIVKIECDFIHLLRVSVHWKHTSSTVSDLQVNNTTTKQSFKHEDFCHWDSV